MTPEKLDELEQAAPAFAILGVPLSDLIAAARREAALRERIEPDLRLVIDQLRENGYSDWPIILERVLALLSEVPQ